MQPTEFETKARIDLLQENSRNKHLRPVDSMHFTDGSAGHGADASPPAELSRNARVRSRRSRIVHPVRRGVTYSPCPSRRIRERSPALSGNRQSATSSAARLPAIPSPSSGRSVQPEYTITRIFAVFVRPVR